MILAPDGPRVAVKRPPYGRLHADNSAATAPPAAIRKWAAEQFVAGFFNYHAVPTTNSDALRPSAAMSPSLAPFASATEPEGYDELGADWEVGGRLAPSAACSPSLAECPLCRQTPKVEAECLNRARSVLCGGR